ncbi:MAG: hypothetical protein OYG31_01680 [Candidatus Kaiserbacteria bacterium]|nr:hypothetical protein [Candidatus Kaiserbacteria bacterium]
MQEKEKENYLTATNVIAVIIVLLFALEAVVGLAILMLWILLVVGNATLRLVSRILRIKYRDILIMVLLLGFGLVLVSVQFLNDIHNHQVLL